MPSIENYAVRPSIVIDGRMIFQEQCHGIARVVIELIRHLPTERDTDVTLIVAEDKPAHFDIADLSRFVKVESTTSPIGRPYDTRDLHHLLRTMNPGVFFSPYHALAPLQVPCPLVVGVHDCIFESDHRLAGGWGRSAAYRLNTERVLRQATAVVVPSLATAQDLPVYYRKVPPVTVCANGVAPTPPAPTADQVTETRARLRLPERFILNVSARRPHKNQAVLIQALPSIPDDVHLVLVGNRDPRVIDPLEQVAADAGVSNRVLFLDSVTDTDLHVLYAGAAVFAFPSKAEGFGLPPLEAMAAGVPVVASAIPVLAEVCRGAALLVSPFSPDDWAAALTSVLASTALRAELIARGRDVAGRSSWTESAESLYGLLNRIARGHRSGAGVQAGSAAGVRSEVGAGVRG
jgi:glycosyltransferase involved in cell wall biosynthesis